MARRRGSARRRGLVRRYVTTKALAGSGRGWSRLAVLMVGASVARRIIGRDERVILREELPPGTSLVISNLDPKR
ncbi:MAG: hypothetical protein AB7L84_14110 [Acidimicrobiia bacterium]